jgi:hypothetical protein
MHLPGLGVPVDPWTGQPLPMVATLRLDRLREAERAFRLALHELDGTTEGSRPGNRHMAEAFTHLEQATMWAFQAILERD